MKASTAIAIMLALAAPALIIHKGERREHLLETTGPPNFSWCKVSLGDFESREEASIAGYALMDSWPGYKTKTFRVVGTAPYSLTAFFVGSGPETARDCPKIQEQASSLVSKPIASSTEQFPQKQGR